ncbi:MAG: hypothetical protein K8R68_12650 [Bacteroidales bacterium]|nr:hypothetical protein [Bacteroidales bacterium]
MFSLNLFSRKPGHEPNFIPVGNLYEFAPHKIKQLMVEVDQLNSYIATLEKSIKKREEKNNAYKNIIVKYDSVIREDISVHKLQKVKIETIEDAYNNYEIFMKEIADQIFSLTESFPKKQKPPTCPSPLKRILLRFIHQKELNQKLTDNKLDEIKQVINKKQQLLETYHSDLDTLKNKMPESLSKTCSQSLSLN